MNEPFRAETDSMGAMQVPAAAYYAAQTARAVENCKYQELPLRPFFSQWISRRSRTAHRRTGDALRDRAGADTGRAALSVIVEVKTVTIIGLTLWSRKSSTERYRGGENCHNYRTDPLVFTLVFTGQSPSGQDYDVYGANIAPFAGETGQLEFTVYPNYNSLHLDDIAFSPQVIPEPSPLALTGVGALVFALYRRFAPKR